MATEKDDICAIARYIHLTDPYIYPVICSSPCNKDWQDIIQGCYFSMDNVFSMKNIIVAEIDNEIIGILCVIPCQRSLHFIKDVPKQSALYSGILKANEGYFEPLIKESMELDGYNITNICVDMSFRGLGVGTALISYCKKRFPDSKLRLDVIADNVKAINLYKKMGFTIVKEYYGFSGTEDLLPCYHMELKQ